MTSEPNQIAVETVGIGKSYGAVQALKSVDVKIGRNEYFVLLGPSGGGKTTLLRLIGGFAKPTAGRVLIDGNDVSALPPDKRPTSMVFQSYALFPHMTVAGNVGYGLKLRGIDKSEIETRVVEILKMVDLDGYQARMPWELSGGQQQRVQLARALVLEPEILLLDEPLAALDEQLRRDMCFWLKHLQERVGITFIHVTHNQEEAMRVADRIALIAAGELVEYGDAREIYRTPKRRFTASFMGESNLLDGKVTSVMGDRATVDLGEARVEVPTDGRHVASGAPVTISMRSELLRMVPEGATIPDGEQVLEGVYEEEIYLGLTTRHALRLDDGRSVAVRSVSEDSGRLTVAPGTKMRLCWPTDSGRLHVD